MEVRLGMLGSRFAARLHAQAARRVPGVRLVAVASHDPARAIEFAGSFGVERAAGSPDDVLTDPDVDVVCICLPSYLHARYAIAAARAGKHVICEKPLATSLTDAEAMLSVCREQGVLLCYAEDWLYAPALLRARELLAEGAIGRVVAVRARECHSGSHSPFAQHRDTCGGGAMMHLGVHPIAAARWLAGAEAVAVTASFSGGGPGNLWHHELEAEDWGVAAIEFANGVRAVIEANYVTRGGRDDVVEVLGTSGCLKIDLTQGSPIRAFSLDGLRFAVEKADTTIGWSRPVVDDLHELGFEGQMRHFAECIATGTPPKSGSRGEDGLAVLQIALAAAEAAAQGKRVAW